LPDIDSTFFHVLCGNLIVSKGSLYVYLFELNLRNLLYVIPHSCGAYAWSCGSVALVELSAGAFSFTSVAIAGLYIFA
ncbi:hypothetical protein, partial [Phascolarctobacterium succinatutens]|uniref:hypothetical protein n=1 Tax=Phascolarctobacterium succinatutens TaxID=626940 RepID=UPI003AF0E8E7